MIDVGSNQLILDVLKCGFTEIYVDSKVLLITESDVAYFYDALRGDYDYQSDDFRIFRIENFLKSWLNNYEFINRYQVLEWMYIHGMSDYRYEGELYRGLYKTPNVELVYGYYMSFTSDNLVARNFSKGMYELTNKECESYIFYKYGEALDLSWILSDVGNVTESRSMKEAIADRRDECEKIAYFDECVTDESNVYV